MIGHVDNAEAIPLVAGETVTTKRGTSGPDWSNLQQDYERLGSFKAIAEEYGVARETVSRKAKELGVKSQRRWRKDNLDPAELRELYESGATVAELAERFHSSMSSIYLRLWMAGTEMRSPGPEGFTWGPEQYAKRAAAVARGAYEGTLSERYRRPGVSARRPTVNSPQEVQFQQALIRARLSFETQCRELRFYPDVKLHQQPILVEIDGWAHGLADNLSADKRRDAELTEVGFTVIRFTNEQVETDADGCVKQLIDRFGLQPEENPVALIRERRRDQQMPLPDE